MRQILQIAILSMFFTMCKTSDNSDKALNVLVYSSTNGFRHKCIPIALQTLSEIAETENWTIYQTEDSLFFTANNLAKFDVLVFLQTSGDILGSEQKQMVETFVETGSGLVTIHSGTITEYNWEWYGKAIGAYFIGHPPVQQARLVIEDKNHPATSFFPADTWVIEDEWYSFDRNPRNDVHVLISIDESSYNVNGNRKADRPDLRMGDHPLVWYRFVGDGRVFQTALGHPVELYADTLFRKHLAGAINWGGGSNY